MDYKNKNQEITDPVYFPMLVPNNIVKGEDSPDEVAGRWEIFNALPEQEKDRLLAPGVAFVLKSITDRCSFSAEESIVVSRLVRDVFFGAVQPNGIAVELRKNIPRISEVSSKDIEETIINKIITADISTLDNKKTGIVKIAAVDISVQYPNAFNQLISSSPIKLMMYPAPVKPSIKNWINDYHEQMGPGKHGTFDRGNYLFHSANTKALTSLERQKLSVILKSIDEGTPLSVDPERQEVIFEQGSANNDQRTMIREQGVVFNEQRKADKEQEIRNNFQQTTYKSQIPNSRPYVSNYKSQLSSQNSQTMDGMRAIKEDERPIAKTEVKQTPRLEEVFAPIKKNVAFPEDNSRRNFPQQSAETAKRPFGLSGMDMNVQKKETAPSGEFGGFAAIPEIDKKEAPASPRIVNNSSLHPSFDSPKFSNAETLQETSAQAMPPKDIPQKPVATPIFQQNKQESVMQEKKEEDGGSVSFSSPQQLPVERTYVPPKRSPFRIVPHGDL